MKINLHKNTPPVSFGLNTQRHIRYITPEVTQLNETVWFKNGNTLRIASEYRRDELVNKLYYLKDSAGRWIKSKLKFYENGKMTGVLRSER